MVYRYLYFGHPVGAKLANEGSQPAPINRGKRVKIGETRPRHSVGRA
jgi:hypothetical protein